MGMIRFWVTTLFIGILSNLWAQEATFPEPLSARTANYDISVELDTDRKMLHAKETIYWKNPS